MLFWVIEMGLEKKVFSFRLDEDLIDILKKISVRQNRTLSNLVETVLKEYVKSCGDACDGT